MLLFAFLLAEENEPPFSYKAWSQMDEIMEQTDSLHSHELFDNIIYERKQEIELYNKFILKDMLNPENFIIETDFIVIDTAFCNSESICLPENFTNASKDTVFKVVPYDITSVDSIFNEMVIESNFKKKYTEKGLYIGTIRIKPINLEYGDKYNNPKKYEHLIITARLTIDIMVDKQVSSDYYKQNVIELITNEEKYLNYCNDCISFTSVDIDSLRAVNEKVKKTISLNREDIYNDSWAVIIGIDKYDNLSNLDYAVADAEAVKDMLINKFDYKEGNVNLLLNEEANRANIVNIISDVSLKARENDRILVFYAGHGETMPLPDGGEMGYLVPIDGNQDNLLASAIPMDDLKRFSNVSKAKHMLFLVDACYGGLAAVGSRGLEPAKTPNYIKKITNIKSRQIITAGGKDEKVFEKSEWGHSAYTKNLLSALEDGYADSNGDGYITADELGDYLSEKVSIDSENQQTPQSRRLTSHEGEFIFIANNMEVNIVNNKTKKSVDDDIKGYKENTYDLIEKIKYPYNLSVVYFANESAIFFHKKLSRKSGFGLGWVQIRDKYPGDYYDINNNIKYTIHEKVDIVAPIGYYHFLSNPEPLFNPVFYFSLGFYNVGLTKSVWRPLVEEDIDISSQTKNFTYIVGMLNQMKLWKHIGVSMGINIYLDYEYSFSKSNPLIEGSQWSYQPVFTLNILDIHNPFKKAKK